MQIQVFGPDSSPRDLSAMAQRVVRLGTANMYIAEQNEGTLVFPPDEENVLRIANTGGALIVQFDEQRDQLAGYCLLHSGRSIGQYAKDEIDMQTHIGGANFKQVMIRSICVDKLYFGQKLGTPMLEEALVQTGQLGGAVLGANLRAWPAVHQFVALRYERAGFRPTGLQIQSRPDQVWWSNQFNEHWGREIFPMIQKFLYMHLVAPARGFALEGVGDEMRAVPHHE